MFPSCPHVSRQKANQQQKHLKFENVSQSEILFNTRGHEPILHKTFTLERQDDNDDDGDDDTCKGIHFLLC